MYLPYMMRQQSQRLLQHRHMTAPTKTTTAVGGRIHPLVRDLYKRVCIVCKDYPVSNDNELDDSNNNIKHIKQLWKNAIRDPNNCPTWYNDQCTTNNDSMNKDENEFYFAIHRGRYMVKEMIGIIQLHKYRCMKERYHQTVTTTTDQQPQVQLHDQLQQLYRTSRRQQQS